ncbi:hypothetical protein HYS48_02380 [Candidatus Woesearchaeota archaeon]|nr:hypothetical protein [Candidatus Woesearchaeota archaeon]
MAELKPALVSDALFAHLQGTQYRVTPGLTCSSLELSVSAAGFLPGIQGAVEGLRALESRAAEEGLAVLPIAVLQHTASYRNLQQERIIRAMYGDLYTSNLARISGNRFAIALEEDVHAREEQLRNVIGMLSYLMPVVIALGAASPDGRSLDARIQINRDIHSRAPFSMLNRGTTTVLTEQAWNQAWTTLRKLGKQAIGRTTSRQDPGYHSLLKGSQNGLLVHAHSMDKLGKWGLKEINGIWNLEYGVADANPDLQVAIGIQALIAGALLGALHGKSYEKVHTTMGNSNAAFLSSLVAHYGLKPEEAGIPEKKARGIRRHIAAVLQYARGSLPEEARQLLTPLEELLEGRENVAQRMKQSYAVDSPGKAVQAMQRLYQESLAAVEQRLSQIPVALRTERTVIVKEHASENPPKRTPILYALRELVAGLAF